MTRIYSYITMLLAAVATLTLTSCHDDDADQAYDLNGVWEGTIQGNYYEDRFHSNDYDTEIRFVQEGVFSRGGYGVEIDYPRDWRKPTVEVGFDWEVRNGKIYLDYEDGYHVIIRDYDMYSRNNRMRFRGYFDDYRTGETLASFDLLKTADDPAYGYAKPHKGGLESITDDDE